jgi:hypothetical protein
LRITLKFVLCAMVHLAMSHLGVLIW